MRESLASIAIAAALAGASGSACAMNAPSQNPGSCRVIGAEQLPAESGGADALCKAIASAAAEQAPGLGYSVEVQVLPQSRLSASVTTADGRKLSEQKFVSMDRPLSSGSFKRFAVAIAAELAKAGGVRS
jgi:hypothetical protein